MRVPFGAVAAADDLRGVFEGMVMAWRGFLLMVVRWCFGGGVGGVLFFGRERASLGRDGESPVKLSIASQLQRLVQTHTLARYCAFEVVSSYRSPL